MRIKRDGLNEGTLSEVLVAITPVAVLVTNPETYGIVFDLSLSPVAGIVTALAAPVASGTELFPVPISRMLLSVTLYSVWARLISSLSRS